VNSPSEVAEIARRSTEVVGPDYAGVDVVEGEDGYYVLEVNPTAGFKGFFEATGISPAPHIARLAIERAGGEVDDEEVQRISQYLDDSRPSSMPAKDKVQKSENVSVGYIEEVIVSGTRGSETVLAKSDTGATRTSIDTELAAGIGTGPIKDIVRVKSGSQERPVTPRRRHRRRRRRHTAHRHRQYRGPRPHGLPAPARPGHPQNTTRST